MTESTHEAPLFTEKEWDNGVRDVVLQMTEFLSQYRTIVIEDFGEHGRAHGSGSFVSICDATFILTNEHVAAARKDGRRLGYRLKNREDIAIVHGPDARMSWPYDLALLPVARDTWSMSHGSKTLEPHQFAPSHEASKGELFTLTGFSGQHSDFRFNTLLSTATCFTTVSAELPEDNRFSSHYHFGLAYPPDLAIDVIGKEGLPLPPGLSGSTVWNTNFVRAKQHGVNWSPELARVTGIIWGWPSGAACLVGTKSEFVCQFLTEAERRLETVDGTRLFVNDEKNV